MAQVGSLYSSLTLESSSFVSGLKKSVEATERSSKSIERNLSVITGAAKGLLAGITLDAVLDVVKGGLEYAASLGEVSQQLGVTTKDLQLYRYAAGQVGIEQDSMDKALAKLTMTMGKAALGAKEPLVAFKSLGVSISDLRMKSAGDIIPELADALGKIKSPAERAALEVALFGKAGQQLDTLLAGGSGQIDGLADSAKRLNMVLTDKQIAQADAASDKFAELQGVLRSNIAGAVANNAGAILRLGTYLESLAGKAVNAAARLGGIFKIIRDYGLWKEMTGFTSEEKTLAGTDGGYVQVVKGKYHAARVALDAAKKNPDGPGGAAGMKMVDGVPLINFGNKPDIAALTDEYNKQKALLQNTIRDQRATNAIKGSVNTATGTGHGDETLLAPPPAKTKAANDELSDLLDKLDPVHKAMGDYAADVAILDKGLSSGRLSQDAYNKAMGEAYLSAIQLKGGTAELSDSLKDASGPLIDFNDNMLATPTLTDKLAASMDDLAGMGAKVGDYFNALNARSDDLASSINNDLSGSITSIITDFHNLGDVALSVLNDIAKAIIDAKMPSGGTGGLGGKIASWILGTGTKASAAASSSTSLFDGDMGFFSPTGHALGGRVGARSLSLVGERGPELLAMGGAAGSIVPNSALRNMRSNDNAPVIVNQTLQVAGGVDLATRPEVARLAGATKQATLQAAEDARRRASGGRR